MRDDDYDYEYDDDDGEGRRSLNQRVAIASVGVSLLVLLLFIVIPVLTDDSGTAPSTDDDANALIVGGATEDPDATGADDSADVTTAVQSEEDQASTDAATESANDDAVDPGSQDDEADADNSAEPDVAAATDSGSDDADTAAATDDSDDADDSEDASDAGDSDDASDSDDATDVDDPTGADDPTEDPDDADGGAAEPTPSNSPSYPTLPDGSPVPVLGIYDGDTIAISGVVPSEESRQLLETLALANSKSPDATIVNFVSIDPTVPDNVGVRVLEKDSVRFPDGSADILPAHAIELDRAVSIMNALPHVSVLVIGHADQRGDEAQNYRISDNRAGAVANYLVESGISPLRVASRPVGEADLLTLNADPESLALNRRTEFVFYGLLAPPPAPADS